MAKVFSPLPLRCGRSEDSNSHLNDNRSHLLMMATRSVSARARLRWITTTSNLTFGEMCPALSPWRPLTSLSKPKYLLTQALCLPGLLVSWLCFYKTELTTPS